MERGQRLEVRPATTPEDFDHVRSLVLEFVGWAMAQFRPDLGPIGSDLSRLPPVFAQLKTELETLPGKYAPPLGALLLARREGDVIGVLAGFPKDAESLEVTRMWVRPEGRGCGAGDALLRALVDHASRAGFGRMVLRSRKEMTSAHAVYRRGGFVETDGAAVFANFEPQEIAMIRPMEGASR